MCGIIAIAANNNIMDELLTGLKRLEYRGYDSSGVAFLTPLLSLDNSPNILLPKTYKIVCHKYKGRVADLEAKVLKKSRVDPTTTQAYTGIGHTRWATHGVPSDINAHPHFNSEIALVHNGIIENHQELKKELLAKKYDFHSQTDTEIILVLLTDLLKKGYPKSKALQKLFTLLKGSFALVIIFKDEEKIYGLKRRSPMIVGYGEGKNYIASDVYAIAGLAQKSAYVEDEEIAVVSANKVEFFDKNGNPLTKISSKISILPNDLEKGTYPHYMLKEINEQTGCLRNNLINHYDTINNQIAFPQLKDNLQNFKRLKIIACGSSFNAGFIAKYWFEKYAKLEIALSLASEFTYSEHNFDLDDTLYLFISQSGETADTIAALNMVKNALIKNPNSPNKISNTSKIIALVNVRESQIAHLSDYVIECFSGPEIGVAATKSFTSQLLSLALLSLKIALDKNLINEAEVKNLYHLHLNLLPNKIEAFLNDEITITNISNTCKHISSHIPKGLKIIFLGRNIFYGLAMEFSLKTQELLYIPTLSFTFGELKHGPIAILDANTLVICLAHSQLLNHKTLSGIEEILAREAKIVLIADKNHEQALGFISTEIFGEFNDITSPIFYTLIAHLMSYNLSLSLGNDVDKPRGLAKSVTVE
ncbi:Glutamine--fructose-6-phosphate aminotransferase [isomerizing] [Candidatus Hepatincolaceae symbiont of Richtersius coronifer]